MTDEEYIDNILNGGSSDNLHGSVRQETNAVDVDSADAIFIPSNIVGNKTDYTQYKVGWYRSVPSNCVLVKMNKYTGRLCLDNDRNDKGELIGGGLHFTFPFFTKSILVPIIDRTIDYPTAEYLTKDNINATVDIVLKVKISDPVLYLKYGKHQLSNLNTLTQNLLRAYVRRHDYHQLSSGRVDLREFQTTRDENGHVLDDDAYDDFEEKYGISVESIQLKTIKLPPELQKLFDDEKEEERKKAAQKIRLEAEQERAEAEARMMNIRTEAEARRARELAGAPIQGLKAQGISSQAIEQNVGVFGAKNSVYIGGANNSIGNETARGVAAGIVAGNNASRTEDNSQDNISQVQKLLNLIEFALNSGTVADVDTYENLRTNLLNNLRLIELVNGFTKDQFNQVAEHVLAGDLGKYFNQSNNNNQRHR